MRNHTESCPILRTKYICISPKFKHSKHDITCTTDAAAVINIVVAAVAEAI
jgi:hypothetical protein